jgi:polysaccharide biosynthesis/export protein
MFRQNDTAALNQLVAATETNYVIKKNDLLSIEVHTNQGEKIVDPNMESFDASANRATSAEKPGYLVDVNGVVKLPLVNELKLEGLTIRQAEQILQKEYARFYQEPFIVLKYVNKRVIVLGTPEGLVVPLANENTRLTEVLALSKAITNDAKVHNIRIIREGKTFISDLSSLKGYLENDIVILPGDIIYVEPVRRPFSEGIREYGPIVSLFTSIGTLVVVVLQYNK